MTQAIQKYTPQESIQLQAVAQELFKSGMFPNAKSPAGVFAVVEYGYELGLPPVTALQNISVINGKMTLTAGLMLSLAVRTAGVAFQVTENTETRCRINFTRTMNGQPSKYSSSFTIEEAKKAGLVKAGSAWEKYPADMLFNRTVARGIRKIAPDVVSGAYIPEEVEAFTAAPEITLNGNGNGNGKKPEEPKKQKTPEKIETLQITSEEVLEAEFAATTDSEEKPFPTMEEATIPEVEEKKILTAKILDIYSSKKIALREMQDAIMQISDGRTNSSKDLTVPELKELQAWCFGLEPVKA